MKDRNKRLRPKQVELNPNTESPRKEAVSSESPLDAAQAERDRLREEAVERRVQAFRDARAKAETERKAKETAEAEAWEKTAVEVMARERMQKLRADADRGADGVEADISTWYPINEELSARTERLERLWDNASGNPVMQARVKRLIDEHNHELAEVQQEATEVVDRNVRIRSERIGEAIVATIEVIAKQSPHLCVDGLTKLAPTIPAEFQDLAARRFAKCLALLGETL